mmetsp:Transcript_8282/g.11528  ORF Transcript_8282/g.11528 Transcript_8282/m.11528 type:complete len:302 (+) Transcript_8282:78-983(+)
MSLFSSLNGEYVTAVKSLLESTIVASSELHGTKLHQIIGRERIGPIHHLALRGLLYADGRHTLEDTYKNILEKANYTRWHFGEMESICGTYVEWAPPASLDDGFIGLPDNPYVFTSLCHVNQLCPKSQALLERLKPFLLGDTSHKNILPLTFEEYANLKNDSQYAAWFVTNTLFVRSISNRSNNNKLQALNHLAYVLNSKEQLAEGQLTTCAELNGFLQDRGWTLNTYNGVTLQADDDGDYQFRQSSVVATPIQVIFQGNEQPTSVPGIFHEFVEHPYDKPFRGFSNARALFSSTSNVQKE